MKTKLFTLLLAIVASIGTMFASETQVDGIWYDFDSSSKTASVTFRGSYYSSYSNEYTNSVVIPASVVYNFMIYSVTSIGDGAFRNCTGLTSVTIPNSVTNIGEQAFYGCSGLTSVTIPNSVTSIGDGAFRACTGLASITIPDSITSIAKDAFQFCSSLTSITIPNSVSNIGDYAFRRCTGLTSVTIEAETPPTLGSSVFDDTNNCPINVQCGTLGTYKSERKWSTYASRISSIPFPYTIGILMKSQGDNRQKSLRKDFR